MADDQPDPVEKSEVDRLAGANPDLASDLYKPSLAARGDLKGFIKRHRKKMIVGGSIGGLAGTIIFVIFSFLAPLKLDFLAKNIEQTRLDRLEYTLNARSRRFMYHLMMAEIAGNKNGNVNDNNYFRAKGWYFSGNPMTQWYKDIRTDRFFDVLERKYGFIFAAESGNARGRLRAISTINLTPDRVKELHDMMNRDGVIPKSVITRFEDLVVNEFDRNQDARRLIRGFIRDETHAWQILRRRHLRRWAGERLGVRRWSFFENTRENTREAVRGRWNKLIGNSMSGKILGCIFSFTLCVDSDDLNDNDNKVTNGNSAEVQRGVDEAEKSEDDGVRRETGGTRRGDNRSVISRLISGKLIFFKALNIHAWLETLTFLHDNISNRKLTKMVAVARAAEYATAYMTFLALTDHLKEGEKVSSEEVNAAMQMINCAEFSDGYQQVVAKQNRSTAQSLGTVFAQQKNRTSRDCPQYEEVTDEMKVNSHNNNAAKVEAWYGDTVGPIVSPIVSAWKGFKGFVCGIPLLGKFICWVFEKLIPLIANLIGQLILTIANFIWDGSEEAAKKVLEKMGEEFITALGAQPICTANETGGRKFNCIDGGAVVTQEQFMASIGGMNVTDVQVRQTSEFALKERQESIARQSWWYKLASLEDPNSLLARTLIKMPNNGRQMTQGLANLTSNFLPTQQLAAVGQSLTVPLANSAMAQADVNENLYGVKHKGFLNKTVEKAEPYEGLPKDRLGQQKLIDAIDAGLVDADKPRSNCATQKAAHTRQLVGDDDIETDDEGPTMQSICKLDDVIGEATKSFFTDEDDGGLDQHGTSSTDPTEDPPPRGIVYPPNLGNPNSEGYYQMPEPKNNEYVFSDGACPAQRYGSKELIGVIYTVALGYKDKYPNSRLRIGDLNASHAEHATHHYGVGVDITESINGAKGPAAWMGHPDYTSTGKEKSIYLGKLFLNTGLIRNIYFDDQSVDNALLDYVDDQGAQLEGVIAVIGDHDDHFHVDIQAKYRGPDHHPSC